jgi:serine/threonine protein kinase
MSDAAATTDSSSPSAPAVPLNLTDEQVRAYLMERGLGDAAAALSEQSSPAKAQVGDSQKSSTLKPPAVPSMPASPTPSKPMPSSSRVPPLEAAARSSSTGTDKPRPDPEGEAAPAAAGDELELWDPRETGVLSVRGADADLWQLDPATNLAPAFPAGGVLPLNEFKRQCDAAPEATMVPTKPYQKQPPPANLPLESFDMRVIYEAGRTGFEDNKDFPIHAGNVIAGRYQVTEYLGSAAFSRAVQCIDLKHNAPVCVKIIRNSKDFFDQALDEVKLLLHINGAGDADANGVLQLYDYFYYKEHVFLVCELLRDNLYEFAKYNREHEPEPYFTLDRVRSIAKQVLTSLSFIHSLGLLHCDLKPENILIKSYSRCIVKVIDFGSSCFTTDSLSSYIQSRCYRAPEVVLGCPYDGRIDVWSLGAILPELITGNVLFHNESLAQMLARIAAVCGPYPEEMLHSGRHTSVFVTAHGAVYEYPSLEVDGQKVEGELMFHFPRPTSLSHLAGSSDPLYLDFLRQCLTIDPTKRPTATELLAHPFLQSAPDTQTGTATALHPQKQGDSPKAPGGEPPAQVA